MGTNRRSSTSGATLFGLPRTAHGRWSIRLASTFFVFFVLWLVYVQATPMARPSFFSDPLHAFLILSAAAAAIAGGIVGVIAMVAKRERSFMILLSIVVGAVVAYWTIAEVVGH